MDHLEQRTHCNESTGCILQCAFRVSNELGAGYLEKVYENALAIELREAGRSVLQQPKVEVMYKGRVVGEYIADLIVQGQVVVEVKAIASLQAIHEAQLMNYLKGTRLNVGLLLNFGRPRLQYRRIVCGYEPG